MHSLDLAGIALATVALAGIYLAYRARRIALDEVRRIHADRINGAAIVTARGGVRLEEFRMLMRLCPFLAGIVLIALEPHDEVRLLTAGLWIASQVIDDTKSVYWAGLRRIVADIERARVRG
jgi:hypothetical protein